MSSTAFQDDFVRELVEGYPAPAMIVDDDVHLLLVNAHARALLDPTELGAPAPARRGGEALRCLHAEGPGGCGRQQACKDCVIRGSVREALAARAVHRARTVMQRRLEGLRVETPVLVSAAPITRGGEAGVLLTLESVADVDLKLEFDKAEQALRAARERAASLARFPEENPDPVLRIGGDDGVLYANPAARALFEALGLEVGRAAPEPFLEPARRTARERQRVSSEVTLADRTYALSFRPAGADVNVYGEDITERRRVEDALRREKERLAVTLRSIGDAVIATDEAGRLTLINAVAEELTGWPADEAIGRPIGEVFHIVHEHTRQPAVDPVERVLREGKIVGLANHTALVARRGTERPIADSAAPIRGADGRVSGVVLVFRDQSEERRAQQTLEGQARLLAEANARLVEADRRKNEFLAALSHELRNPLAPIRNSLYVLDHAAAGSAQAARAKAVVNRQVSHLAELVDDLLDVTRISRGKIALSRSRIDLGEVVRGACEDHRTMFEERAIALRLALPAAPAWIDADATRVAQIVSNLLQNAAKFTPAGGSTTVALEDEREALAIRVRDDGIGIDPALVQKVFEPFTQAESGLARSQGGLGLGLALVKGLAELHGGSVRALSEGPNRGSEFVVTLPRACDPGLAGAVAHGTQAPAPLTVLIIEDFMDSAQSLADVLELAGHRVRFATSGRAGVDLARELRPDVVLCDIGLPDVNGYEIARLLRAEAALASSFLVALSGYARPEDRQRSAEAGFDAHLAKPTTVQDLDAVFRLRAERPTGAARAPPPHREP